MLTTVVNSVIRCDSCDHSEDFEGDEPAEVWVSALLPRASLVSDDAVHLLSVDLCRGCALELSRAHSRLQGRVVDTVVRPGAATRGV